MTLWRKLKYLLPSVRRVEERDMLEELEALAAIAEIKELGNRTRAAEEVRSVWGWPRIEEFYRDAQYAFRMMRANPGFATTVVLSLALGIGANTAIFSLIDALMLRWLPVRNPQELVLVKTRSKGDVSFRENFSYPIVRALAEQKDIFAGVAGFSGTGFLVGPPGSVNSVNGAWVTGEYYETLGLNPLTGRLLGRADDEPGAPDVAVITDGYWERQFSRNPGIIGQTIPVNGIPVTIVGVSPAGFTGANVGQIADITMPIANITQVNPTMAVLLNPGNFWLRALARPRDGVSARLAESRLQGVWPEIAARLLPPNFPSRLRKAFLETELQLAPGGTGHTFLREMFKKPLLVLMAAVGLVLLIACANVANLLLARASARQREIAIRLAIGAGRGRIVRQLLTESTLLAILGAVLGVGLAWATTRWLVDSFSAAWGKVTFDLTPNVHVLGFTALLAIGTGIFFGLAPALRATAVVGSRKSRLSSVLMTTQVALSLVLLIGAGLFVRTLQNLRNVDVGFNKEGVLLVSLDGRREGYQGASLAAFYDRLLARIGQLPGVLSASLSQGTPLGNGTWTERVARDGDLLPENENAIFLPVTPRFFETLQTPLLQGRDFNDHDTGTFKVAIVSEAFAQRYFPNENPVGQFLLASVTKPPSRLEIVGVVRNIATEGIRLNPYPTVYVSYRQREPQNANIELRAAGSLSQVAQAVRTELRAKLPSTAVEVHGLTEQVEASLIQERMMAMLGSGFGALALVLACVGLYGLLAYSVARRTKEMGIRMALGARPLVVEAMVVRDAVRLVLIGIALGLPTAWAASRLIASMLFHLKPTDPATLAGAALVLLAAALTAAYLPARRASRVNPMTALRHD
jgi:putative ABC transport system permease protein